MQTLGITDSTPRTESRSRALFWPTIRNEVDFDYITRQGFWVCFGVAAMSLVVQVFTGAPPIAYIESAFFFLAAIGVRERSVVAASLAFVAYLLDLLVVEVYTGGGLGVLRIVGLALLLANIRGSWLSSRWEQDLATPFASLRMNETIADKLVDQLPTFLWPKLRWIFYALAAIVIATLGYLLSRALLIQLPR
jgi:hypothetical protein